MQRLRRCISHLQQLWDLLSPLPQSHFLNLIWSLHHCVFTVTSTVSVSAAPSDVRVAVTVTGDVKEFVVEQSKKTAREVTATPAGRIKLVGGSMKMAFPAVIWMLSGEFVLLATETSPNC